MRNTKSLFVNSSRRADLIITNRRRDPFLAMRLLASMSTNPRYRHASRLVPVGKPGRCLFYANVSGTYRTFLVLKFLLDADEVIDRLAPQPRDRGMRPPPPSATISSFTVASITAGSIRFRQLRNACTCVSSLRTNPLTDRHSYSRLELLATLKMKRCSLHSGEARRYSKNIRKGS